MMKTKIIFLAIISFTSSNSMEKNIADDKKSPPVERTFSEPLIDGDARLAAQLLGTRVDQIKRVQGERRSLPIPKAPSS